MTAYRPVPPLYVSVSLLRINLLSFGILFWKKLIYKLFRLLVVRHFTFNFLGVYSSQTMNYPPPLDPSNFLPSRMISNYFFSYSLFLSMFFIRLTFDVYYLFHLYIYFCQTWFWLMVWWYMVEKPPQSNQSTTRQTLPFTHISFKGVREARIARIESYKYVLLG